MLTWFIILIHAAQLFAGNRPASPVLLKEVVSIGNSAKSSFVQVGDIVPDDEGNIFVSDQIQFKIKKFDSQGAFVGESGARGKGAGDFRAGPAALDGWHDLVAAVDLGTPRILVFGNDFRLKQEIIAAGPVCDISFTADGRLFASMVPVRDKAPIVRLFGPDGRKVSDLPLITNQQDPPGNISMVASCPDGGVAVAFPFVNRITLFDAQLRPVRTFGLPGMTVRTNGSVSTFAPLPEENYMRDISVDADGRIFVLGGSASAHPNRDVFVMNREGALLKKFILPEESGMLRIDRRGFLFTRAGQRTVVKKYRVLHLTD